MPCRRAILAALACALACLATPAPPRAEAPRPRLPSDVPGLVAWYHLDPVHRRSSEGEPVDRWADTSGHNHMLRATWETQPPVFHPNRLNGKPEVTLRRANRFDVHEPFELGDHTIFIVYDSALTQRAFLSSDTDRKLGIVLRDEGTFHYLQDSQGGEFRYNRVDGPVKGFTVTVLGRTAGSLRAFINGADVSSGLRVGTPLRVARLFDIEHTVRVKSDGEGLRIAEMVFYDRYLTDEERGGVTAQLADKFGLELYSPPEPREPAKPGPLPHDPEAIRIRATSRSDQDLNLPTVAVAWDTPGRVDGPFHFDAESGGTRVVCTKDGTRARVTATLPLRSRTPGARIRLLVLLDGREYLAEEGLSQPFSGSGEDKASTVALQVELTLNAGQFFQIITSADAEPGVVRVSPAEPLLIVEQMD
jgi:hypothetical protein